MPGSNEARRLSIVVPVFNSEPTVRALVETLDHELSATYDLEIVLVDDSSTDDSWTRITELAGERSDVVGLALMRNYGQHNALLAGIREASHPVIVTMDDDLQHPPSEVAKLVERLDAGFDVVYGTPIDEQHDIFRRFASRITKLALQGVMGSETARQVSAFRAVRTQLRDGFADYSAPFVSVDVLLTWATSRFSSVPVRHDPRRVGKSNYRLSSLLNHALNMTTGFSARPLQFASMTGFAFALIGFALLLFVLIRTWLNGGSVPGFPFLASTIALFSGVQLFALGIIGEYLARMHFRLMAKPTYVVAERACGQAKN